MLFIKDEDSPATPINQALCSKLQVAAHDSYQREQRSRCACSPQSCAGDCVVTTMGEPQEGTTHCLPNMTHKG